MKNTFLKNANFCVCMCNESYKEHFLLCQPVLVILFKVSFFTLVGCFENSYSVNIRAIWADHMKHVRLESRIASRGHMEQSEVGYSVSEAVCQCKTSSWQAWHLWVSSYRKWCWENYRSAAVLLTNPLEKWMDG